MKKRIFTLLLLVLLVAVLLPVFASAEGSGTVYVQLPSDDGNGNYKALPLNLSEGDTYYFLTLESGLVTTEGASAKNYNLKFDYPAGGTPTLYLKDAYLRNNRYTTLILGNDSTADNDFIIYAETDSTLFGGSVMDEDIYYAAIGSQLKGLLTITGPGKLTLTADQTTAVAAAGEILFKDITVDISNDMTRTGIRPAIHAYGQGNVIFDNAVANIYCNIGPCIWVFESHYEKIDNDQERDVIIRNGSIVTMRNDNDAKGLVGASGEFIIDSSDVEINSPSLCFDPKPTMTGVYAIGGEKKSNAKEYKASKAKSYGYFKTFIGDAPETLPTEEETVPETEPEIEETTPETQPPVNDPGTSGGKIHLQLCTDDGSGNYKALALTIKQGETYYFLNTEAGLLTEDGASADNYNVKIDNPADGVATMYLKDAYIRSEYYTAVTIGSVSESGIRDFDFVIYVETESTVVGGTVKGEEENIYYSAIGHVATGSLTITGPGKLNLIGEQTTTIYVCGELLFKDITVDITNNMTRVGIRPAVHSAGTGDVIFDNAVANIYCNIGPCIWVYESHYEKLDNDQQRNVIIRNGSIMTMRNDNDAKGLVGCSGEFIIDSSDVEINTTGLCFDPKPTMTGVTAVGGEKKSNAKEYKASKAKSYGYFKTTIGEAPTTEATEPATEPTTEPTTKPTTAPTNPPATQPTTPATKPTTAPTTPATKPGSSDQGAQIQLDLDTIVIIAGMVVIVACFITGTIIVVKRKKAE